MTAAGIMQAHVCGPLGQVLAVIGGETWLYEVAGDRRRPTHNDIRFFFDHGLEVRPIIGAGGSRVDISELPAILERETRSFRALHGVLFGMDPELDDATRTRSMRRAATLLADPAIDDFVSHRFLRPPDEGAWDVAHALELARSAELPVVARLYAIINGPLLRRIEDTVREWAGVEGFDAVRRADLVARTYDNGLAAAAAVAVAAHDNDRTRLGNLLFRAAIAKWDRRLVAHLANVLMPPAKPLPIPDDEKDEVVSNDAYSETTTRSQIQAALDAHHANKARRQGHRRHGADPGRRRAAEALDAVMQQLDWIAARFLIEHPGAAWNAVVDLARQQLATGEPAHLAMSLTNLATRLGPRTQPALALCDLAALCAPDDPFTRTTRAEVFRRAGQLDEALAVYQHTARDFPQNAVARNGLAETLRELGRLNEALAAYQQTARDFPQDAYARTGLAETLRELGRLDEALTAYQQTGRDFPQDAVARTGLAETLRELGRLDEALVAYQHTARDFPQNAVARNGLAETLRELGRLNEALAAYQQTARDFPQDAYARTGLAETLRELGRLDEALTAYQQTGRDFPQDAVARTGLAETLRELGRLDEALVAYQHTARDFPQDAYARTGLAETLRELGRLDEALTAYQQTGRDFPQDAVARTGLAETLRELGRLDEALAAYQQTARDFPQDVYARTGHATILVELGQPEAARAVLRNVSRPPVTHADWIATHILCMIELRAGGGLALVSDLERFVQTCPYVKQQRYFRTSLAVARLVLKQTGPARASLSALAADPGLVGIELAAINLMKAHAEALDGDLQAASRSLDTASNVFPYEEFRVRRIRQEMQRRFGLGGVPRLTLPTQIAAADQTLVRLEMDFVANRASRSGPQPRMKAA